MSVVAAAIVTSTAAGAYSAYKGAKAQKGAVDAQSKAASRQDQLAREQFEWQKQVYEDDTKPAAERDAALRQRLIDNALEISDEQRAFADEQNDYYKDTFQPVERRVVQDAMDYDSEDKVAARADRAGAEVAQQFSNARGQNWRGLARMGINPNSGAFASMGQRMTTDQALGTAAAKNNSRQAIEDKAISLRAGAANFGRNMPNSAANYYSGSVNSGRAAGDQSVAAMRNSMLVNTAMNDAYQNYIRNKGTAANRLVNSHDRSSDMWGQTAASFGGLSGSMIKNPDAYSNLFSDIGGMFGGGGSAGVQGLPSGADASLFW